jgi:RNA polymerase sigma-70 factor (ECF subfamily)
MARSAARGDQAALNSLVRDTQGDVWRLCAHLVDPASADDLAQETYLRAIPALRQFRGDGPVRTWLLTIARRVCAQEIKSRQRARQVTASLNGLDVATHDAGPEAELMMLLAVLEPGRRAAFVLTQILGCSYAETAEISGCPVGTIRSRVARARDDLAAMITSGETVARRAGTSGSLGTPRCGRPVRKRSVRRRPGPSGRIAPPR